jgi:hypothetical protein
MVSDTLSSRQVTSPASRAYEQSAARRHTVELYCSVLSAHLVGYNDIACSHVLQTHDGSDVIHLGNMRT